MRTVARFNTTCTYCGTPLITTGCLACGSRLGNNAFAWLAAARAERILASTSPADHRDIHLHAARNALWCARRCASPLDTLVNAEFRAATDLTWLIECFRGEPLPRNAAGEAVGVSLAELEAVRELSEKAVA